MKQKSFFGRATFGFDPVVVTGLSINRHAVTKIYAETLECGVLDCRWSNTALRWRLDWYRQPQIRPAGSTSTRCGIEIVGKRGARGTTQYHPVVRFQPIGHTTNIVFKAKPGLWPSPFDDGDEVVVAYDPDHPDDARIDSFWMLWFLPGVIILFGLGCLLAGRDTIKKIV